MIDTERISGIGLIFIGSLIISVSIGQGLPSPEQIALDETGKLLEVAKDRCDRYNPDNPKSIEDCKKTVNRIQGVLYSTGSILFLMGFLATIKLLNQILCIFKSFSNRV